MAPQPSIKIVKKFTYRGTDKLWSNRHHFTGGSPSSDAHWETLADAITALEHPILPASTHIRHAIGYDAGSDIPTWSKDYDIAGTLTLGGSDVRAPGDVAALVRLGTDAVSIKNHPIYLYNYWHDAVIDESTGRDAWSFTQGAPMQTYYEQWLAGFSDGAVTHKRCGPRGAVALTIHGEEYVTHRDFPR